MYMYIIMLRICIYYVGDDYIIVKIQHFITFFFYVQRICSRSYQHETINTQLTL